MNSSLKQFPIAAWRFLAVIAFALWIGGFTFHTAVTLRVGGDIIGGLEQGYVTQAALGKLHGFALDLIRAGKAFVCHQTRAEMEYDIARMRRLLIVAESDDQGDDDL